MRKLLSYSLLSLVLGCSAIVDFDNVDDLPCPCDSNHVCDNATNRCLPRGRVDDFKSCTTTASNPDDLCRDNRICVSVNSQIPRCLPRCTPTGYATPESGINVAAECPFGTACFPDGRGGGVCSEGVCSDLPNNCPPPQRCIAFNGAGICFTPCEIFQLNPLPCAGDQLCHPIGATNLTACVESGTVQLTQPCSDVDMCAKQDEFARGMVCEVPFGSTDPIRRCRATCAFGVNTSNCIGGFEGCVLSRPNIDPETGAGLGICL
jgi:hypothetical protein